MDRLVPPLRLTLIGFAGLALIAGALLFIGATETDDWFSWTIQPPLTAAAMGGIYWGACVLIASGATAPGWRAVRPAAFVVLVIATTLLVVTLIHLDRFDMDSLFGVFWLCAYIIAPPLIAWGMLEQSRSPADGSREFGLYGPLRAALGLEGAVMAAASLVMLLAPDSAADVWPWALSPLTSRALGTLIGAVAFIALYAAWEGSTGLSRGLPAAYITVGAFQLLAVALHSSDLGDDELANAVYVGFSALILSTGLAGLFTIKR
jgi:hypothetical protein